MCHLILMKIDAFKSKVKFYVNKARAFLPEPLPQGSTEFQAWADSIQSLFDLPTKDKDSVHFMLGSMLMHIGPQEDRKSKYHFVKSIRSAAAKQVGGSAMYDIKIRQQEAQKAAEAAKTVEAATNTLKVVTSSEQAKG